MSTEPPLSLSVATQTPAVVIKKELPVPSIPYRGIEHYRFADHRIFFARQTETIELMRSVMTFKGVILFGSSGVGKSSLIDAGLLPRLIDMDFSPDRIRVQNRADAEIVIERISQNADGKARYLSPSLAEGITDDERPRAVLSLQQFEERLRAHAEDHYPLLVLDQFEEIITLFEETSLEPESREEVLKRQKSLIGFFVGILHDETLRCKVLFSFREDYLAKLTRLFVLAPELPNQFMRLISPQQRALDDIIIRPLAPNLQVHYKRQQQFSPELVEELKAEFRKRADGDAINLSEVQIVCLQLWESDDPLKLFAERDVQGLLEDYLTDELNTFSDENRSIAIGLLSHMLTVSNTRNFVSGVQLIHMFRKEEPVSEETLKDVLVALTGTRLVRRELRHRDYFYEISSEFLVPKIIEKKAERQIRFERAKLGAEREEERRQARQKLTQKNRLLALGALVTVLSLALAFVLFQKKQEQEKLRLEAQTAQGIAIQTASDKEKIISILRRLFKNLPVPQQLNDRELGQLRLNLSTDTLNALSTLRDRLDTGKIAPDQAAALLGPSFVNNHNPQIANSAQSVLSHVAAAKAKQAALQDQVDQEKLRALDDMRNLMRAGTFPAELVFSLLGPIGKNANPALEKTTNDLVAEAYTQNDQFKASVTAVTTSDPTIANRLPARVFIGLESDQQLSRAQSLKAELEKNGYIVPDFEIVGYYRAPRNNELRYYKKADEKQAQEIAAVLKNLQLDVKVKHLEQFEDSNQAKAGHYELWLASQSAHREEKYLMVSGVMTEEKRQSLLDNISSVTEDDKIVEISQKELVIGPLSEDQAKTLRRRLIDQDADLGKKGRAVIFKH